MNKIFRTAIFVMAMMTSASFAFAQTQNTDNGIGLGNTTALNAKATIADADEVKLTIVWHNDNGSISGCYEPATQSAIGVYVGNNTFEFTNCFFAPTHCFLPNNGGACVNWSATAYNTTTYPKKLVTFGCGTFEIVPGNDGTYNYLIIEGTKWNKCMGSGEYGPGGIDP